MKFITAITIGIVITVFLGLAFAQDPSYPLCEHALEISPTAFIALYGSSELDANLAASFWADCRRQENDVLMRGMQTQRHDVLRLREAFGEMTDAWMGLQLTRWGGSSMYTHLRNRQQPAIEEAVARLVRLVLSGYARTTSEVLAYEVEAHWQALDRDLARLESVTSERLAQASGVDVASVSQDWQEALHRYRQAQRKVESILEGRFDLLAFETLEFIRSNNRLNLRLLELP